MSCRWRSGSSPSCRPDTSSGTPLSTIAMKTRRWCSVSSASTAARTAAMTVPPLRYFLGLEPEPVGQTLPVLLGQGEVAGAPEVTTELRRDLEHHELVRPGGETTLTAELPELRHDSDEGVGRGLVCEIVDLGTRGSQLGAAAVRFRAQPAAASREGGRPPHRGPDQRFQDHASSRRTPRRGAGGRSEAPRRCDQLTSSPLILEIADRWSFWSQRPRSLRSEETALQKQVYPSLR